MALRRLTRVSSTFLVPVGGISSIVDKGKIFVGRRHSVVDNGLIFVGRRHSIIDDGLVSSNSIDDGLVSSGDLIDGRRIGLFNGCIPTTLTFLSNLREKKIN